MRESVQDYRKAVLASLEGLAELNFRYVEDSNRNERFFVFSAEKPLQDQLVREFLVRCGFITDLGRLDRNFSDRAVLAHVRSGKIAIPSYVWNRHLYLLDTEKVDQFRQMQAWGKLPEIVPLKRRRQGGIRLKKQRRRLTDGAGDVRPDFRFDEA
jgi:hypothetical protein